MLKYHKKLKLYSLKLRKEMTETEVILWSRIKGKQISNAQFYRQKPIGNYIVDFFCPKHRLVIEIDGGQHFREKDQVYDKVRDDYLLSLEITVLGMRI